MFDTQKRVLNVVMPVYNEARTVRSIIEDVLDSKIDGLEIYLIIVGGGSNDGTDGIIQEFAERLNVKVLIQNSPSGKGNAVRAGFEHLKNGIVLIQDGDREYRVEDYPKLVEPILKGETDFVLGSRYSEGPMRKFGVFGFRASVMNFGHLLFTFLFNLIYGVQLKDPFTMFKVFNSKCIDNMRFVSDRFDFDYELLAKLIRSGFVPLEIPITYVSRGFDEGKKVRLIRDPISWLVALVKFKFCRIN